ncbi:MAG: phage tail protein [Clostridia bacterium]|nr:phage tail protein [Clostridia bacterium]
MPEDRQVLADDVLSSENAALSQGLKYPIRGHRFTVTLEGLGLMSFKSVEGFSAEIGTTEYREGAFKTLGMRKLPTMLTYPDVTLAKGMYSALTLYDFFMGYLNGKSINVGQMEIIAYDNDTNPIAKWQAFNVWPTRYESGGLSADSAEILIETVTFATEGVYRIQV